MQFAPLYPFLYRVLRPCFPQCLWAGNPDLPQIALTFDDGPHPEYTPALLAVLNQFKVKASFFLLGQWVDRYPHVVKQIHIQGHGLGIHGYPPRLFTQLSLTELNQSLYATQPAIARACKLDRDQARLQVRDVRPPVGVVTWQIAEQIRLWGYRPVMWGVVPEDWREPGPSVVVDRVLGQVTNGALVVLHDGLCGGKDVVATIAQLLPHLLDQGYQFVTVDQFWQTSQTISR